MKPTIEKVERMEPPRQVAPLMDDLGRALDRLPNFMKKKIHAWIVWSPSFGEFQGSFFGLRNHYWSGKTVEEVRSQLRKNAAEQISYRDGQQDEFIATVEFESENESPNA